MDGWGTPGGPRIPGLVWHGGVQQGVTTNLYMLLPDRIVAALDYLAAGEPPEAGDVAGFVLLVGADVHEVA